MYRIGAEGAEEERVLLTVLSELDSAYKASYEKQLEQARAELLSSSMSFQVIADEIREGQQAAAKKWEKEVRLLKEHQSTNQKRLFLLEQEKEQLQKVVSTADSRTGALEQSVAGLSEENSQLRTRAAALEAQLAALQEVVADGVGRLTVQPDGGGEKAASAAGTQTEGEAARRRRGAHAAMAAAERRACATGSRRGALRPAGEKQTRCVCVIEEAQGRTAPEIFSAAGGRARGVARGAAAGAAAARRRRPPAPLRRGTCSSTTQRSIARRSARLGRSARRRAPASPAG